MNTITPRPYVNNNGQSYKTENESEEKAGDSLDQNGRQQGNGNRGNQERKTIASGRAEDMQPPTARRRAPVSMGQNRKLPPKPVRNHTNPQMAPQMPQQAPMSQPVQKVPQPARPVTQQQAGAQPQQQPQAPQTPVADGGEIPKSNRINIAQIIKDFRGTYNAIGTPQCLVDEVESYLQDIITHTKGEAPSINYVQTNLQNAAIILDTYISKTLEKESKVVQNWLDALFLQRINYRYNDGEINEDFLVKFPEGNTPQQPDSVVEKEPEYVNEPVQEIPDYEPIPEHHTAPIKPTAVHRPEVRKTPQRPPQQVAFKPTVRRKKPQITVIPEDNELKALFIQAKKQAYSHNPAKAMNIFQKALLRAEAIRDNETQSKICYEMGKIYDDNNYLSQALNSYNNSLRVTTDNSIKTKAHYSMAKIYDDVNQTESAINHYMTSVSYAGAEDNLSSQSQSLTNIANIYTDRYDRDAFIFYDEANVLVEQTDDSEMKGYVSSNTAGAYNKFNKPDKALKCYANAVKNYSDAKVANSVAENYKAAGELMYDLRNPAKAKILLRKALAHTDSYKDRELINEIKDLLEEIG